MLTAVVGPSGAGKSTIADLVNGLLLPTRGRLLLDGRALTQAELRQWRRQVGYVGQETVLFHQSVRENLLWAKPDASEDELREALEMASAGFVYELPGGLETVAGDRGVLLSSGERQRISLARALLRKPTLLILDEATNALDVENEARILDAIREAMRSSKQEGRGALTVLDDCAPAERGAPRRPHLRAGRRTHRSLGDVGGAQGRDAAMRLAVRTVRRRPAELPIARRSAQADLACCRRSLAWAAASARTRWWMVKRASSRRSLTPVLS